MFIISRNSLFFFTFQSSMIHSLNTDIKETFLTLSFLPKFIEPFLYEGHLFCKVNKRESQNQGKEAKEISHMNN